MDDCLNKTGPKNVLRNAISKAIDPRLPVDNAHHLGAKQSEIDPPCANTVSCPVAINDTETTGAKIDNVLTSLN